MEGSESCPTTDAPSYPVEPWFFTVNLLQRHQNDLLVREIDLLRETVRRVRERYPFQFRAWLVLPGHYSVPTRA